MRTIKQTLPCTFEVPVGWEVVEHRVPHYGEKYLSSSSKVEKCNSAMSFAFPILVKVHAEPLLVARLNPDSVYTKEDMESLVPVRLIIKHKFSFNGMTHLSQILCRDTKRGIMASCLGDWYDGPSSAQPELGLGV